MKRILIALGFLSILALESCIVHTNGHRRYGGYGGYQPRHHHHHGHGGYYR